MTSSIPQILPRHGALRRGRVSIPRGAYHLTAITKGRQRFFSDFEAARVAARSFDTPAVLGDARLLAWVLMPDHAHLLLQLGEKTRLDEAVCRLKTASARSVNAALGRKGSLWSRAYHDHAIRDTEDLRNVARYIVANPLRAGLVQRLGDYPFWNAIWL